MTDAQTTLIQAWLRYGFRIERDSAGYWQWAETDDSAERLTNGPLSPPFSTFERCIADLEESMGPLP